MGRLGSLKVQRAILVVLLVVLSLVLALLVTGVLRLGPAPGPGAATLDYLRATPYVHLTVEVDYVTGEAPDGTSMNLLRTRVLQVTDKTDVAVLVDTAFPSGGSGYAISQITALESAHRSRHSGGDTAVLYFVYVDGTYVDASQPNAGNALAIAYGPSSIVVFKERIRAAASPGPFGITATDIENSAVVHEFGHILGLVNLVYHSDLNYEDAAHPNHSSNRSDVMYWAIEASGVGGVFGSAPPTDFVFETRHDLASLKSGALAIRRVSPPPIGGFIARVSDDAWTSP